MQSLSLLSGELPDAGIRLHFLTPSINTKIPQMVMTTAKKNQNKNAKAESPIVMNGLIAAAQKLKSMCSRIE